MRAGTTPALFISGVFNIGMIGYFAVGRTQIFQSDFVDVIVTGETREAPQFIGAYRQVILQPFR